MAVNINLLPPEIKLQRELKHKQQKIVFVGSLAGIVLLLVYGVLLLATFQVRADAADLAKEREALLNKFPTLEQYAALQTQVNNNEEILKQAVGAPPDWVTILYQLGKCMPSNVWLTDFFASYQQGTDKSKETPTTPTDTKSIQDKVAVTGDQLREVLGLKPEQTKETPLDGGVTFSGYADDRLAVAELLENIQQQVSGVTGVNCQVLSQEELDGRKVIYFEISAELLPGPSMQPKGGTAVNNQ